MKTRIFQIILLLFPIAIQAQSTFTIGSGANFIHSGSTRVVLSEMDFVNDGVLAADNSQFVFRGANWNTIGGASLSTFYDIYLDKIGIAGVYLLNHVNLDRELYFSEGFFDPNGFTLFLDPINGRFDNETETSRFMAPFGGEAMITVDLNAPFQQNPGNLGVEITSLDNLGLTTIRRGHLPQTLGVGTSIERYYDVYPTAAAGTYAADAKFHYFDAELNGNSEGQITLWDFDSANWDLENYDNEDQTGDWLAIEQVTDFNWLWTIGPSTQLDLNIKTFLQGPISGGLMNDDLRVNNLLPMGEPYSTNPNLNTTRMQNPGETIFNPAILTVTGNDAIVDWIYIELRDKNTPSDVISSRAALLQRDGDIVAVDGVSYVRFHNLLPDEYFIAVRHRNHLGVMTQDAIMLNAN